MNFATDSSVVTLLIKATIVFSIGAGAAFALRNRSASVRHAVWALTIAAAAGLPIGMIAAPEWGVAILPGSDVSAGPRQQSHAAESSIAPVTSDPISPAITEAPGQVTITENAGRSAGIALPEAPVVIALLWLAGTLAILLRMAVGFYGLRRVTRRASPIASPEFSRVIMHEKALSGVDRGVHVFASGDVSTPLTFGTMSPVILLPAESARWSDAHMEVVMRHEMAHIAARDSIICILAGVTCALYWFHPLAWLAAGRLRREQERACDDRVLSLGTEASEYAEHLLDVARSARSLGMPGFVSVAMARPSELEGRLLAVLDDSRDRGSIRTQRRRMAFVSVVVVAFVFAAVKPEARAAELVIAAGAGSLPALPPMTVSAAITTTSMIPAVETKSHAPAVDSVVEQSVSASPGGLLTLELKTGASVSIVGSDDARVHMRATLRGRDWRDTGISLTATTDGARIVSRYLHPRSSQSSSHRIDLRVPRNYNVRLSSAGGGITIREVNGDFAGSTGGGDIRIDRASGRAQLKTGGGPITVTNSNLMGSVGTGGGAVLIQGVSGGLSGSSGTGDVVYGRGGVTFVEESRNGLRRSTDGRLWIRKSGGNVDLPSIDEGADISTGGGHIFIGRASGDLTANTGGGEIRIRSLNGSANLSTGAGDVSVNVTSARAESIKVWSGSGKVVLTVPADMSASFDIETAYTRGHGPTRIESDWELPVTETTDWDSSEGTARRYVRAKRTIGGGGALIRVRTINGDVVIRRER